MMFFPTTVSLLATLLTVITTSARAIPKSGSGNVSVSTLELVDPNRLDPYAPKSIQRRLMLSIFAPSGHGTCNEVTTAYMPPQVASAYDSLYSTIVPNGTFSTFQLSSCSPARHLKPSNTKAMLLFSPGLGNSRLIYNYLAKTVASYGHTVITIDHPYDAAAVTFDDGSTIYGLDLESEEQLAIALDVRTADVSFVIDQVRSNATLGFNYDGLIHAFGHSYGGATAANAMIKDTRITSGMNLDGSYFGQVLDKGVNHTFISAANEERNLTSDDSWASMYANSTGAKVVLGITGAVHGTFTDMPLLADGLVGDNAELRAALTPLLGSMSGADANRIVGEVVDDWVRAARDGKLSSKEVGWFSAIEGVVVHNSSVTSTCSH